MIRRFSSKPRMYSLPARLSCQNSGARHHFRVKINRINTMNIYNTNDHKDPNRSRAFTLIEVLVVIGIIAILAAVVLVAVNPVRQFKLARDSQRTANVEALLNAIRENISEHGGSFVCGGVARALPPTPTVVRYGGGFPLYAGDIASCLVTDYLSSMPSTPPNPERITRARLIMTPDTRSSRLMTAASPQARPAS